MDSHVRDLLDQVIKRLNQIENQQSKLDLVLERLEMLQNILEKQNHAQYLVGENLADMTSVNRQEKIFVLDQIKESSREDLEHLSHVELQLNGNSNEVSSNISDANQYLHQVTESQLDLSNVGNDVKDEHDLQDDQTTRNPYTATAQKCHNLPKSSHYTEIQLDDTTIGPTDHVKDNLKTILAEVGSIPDVVRGQTRAELVWLDNQIDKRLSDIDTTVREKLEYLIEEMASVVNKMESVESSLNTRIDSVREDLAAFTKQNDLVTTKIEISTNDIKDYVYKTKCEIFAVTEKEAQIVRDQLEGPLLPRKEYTFDFYVDNFKALVRSEKDIHSLPWYVNEMKSSMMGMVWFRSSGQMEVCFVSGRHPREVGLEPKSSIKLKVKATICDINKKVLPLVNIGEKTWNVIEKNISCNYDWGCKLGNVSCDDLIQKGYGEKEDYRFGALLIRFEVKIC